MTLLDKLEFLLENKEKKKEIEEQKKKSGQINPMIRNKKAVKLSKMGVNTELIRAIYFLIFRRVSRKKAEETLDEIISYLQDIRKKLSY